MTLKMKSLQRLSFFAVAEQTWGEESITRTSTEEAVEAEAAVAVAGDAVEVVEEAGAAATALLAAKAAVVVIPTLHVRVVTTAARMAT